MQIVLNTEEVEERHRPEFVHEALGTTLVPIELHWPVQPDGVVARGLVTDVGDLTICSGRTSAWRVERTPKLARDSMEPSVFINVQHFGSSLVVQHGREAVAHAGELVMYDAAAPYTLLNETGVTGDFFRIPHSALALPADMISEACAVKLSPGHPLTSLTNDYLRRVAADPALYATPSADLIARPTVELVRAVITTHLRAERMAAEPLAATLQVRILEYARQHLHEPDLTIEQIAAAHYISVRQLYKIFSTSGIGLADWIRRRRLEGVRQALKDSPRSTTISAIARRFGFSDMSSFSRSFRIEYGMTPRELRNRQAAATESPQLRHCRRTDIRT